MTSSEAFTSNLTMAQRAALTAYLEPLCAKHEKGVPVTYEDLLASKRAADSVAKEASATVRTDDDDSNNIDFEIDVDDDDNNESDGIGKFPTHTLVQKIVHELHANQIALYKTAATNALQEWASSWALPAPQTDESWSDYRQRWWTAAQSASIPDWKVDNLESVIKPVLQGRAMALYNAKRKETSQHLKADVTAKNVASEKITEAAAPEPATTTTTTGDKTPDSESMEEGEEDEDEVEEGEEEEGEDGEIEDDDEDDENEEEMAEEAEAAAADGDGENKPAESQQQQQQQQQQAPPSNRKKRKKNTNNAAGNKQPPKKKALPNKPLGQSKTVRRKGGGRRGGRAGGGGNNNK